MSIVRKNKMILKFTHYFSAQHSLQNKEEYHSHTFTITIYLKQRYEGKNLDFSLIQSFLNDYFRPYVGEKLNCFPCFKEVVPTIEGMGSYFYEDLKEKLKELDGVLLQLDICENPLRVFSASEGIFHYEEADKTIEKKLESLLKNKNYNRRG